MTSTARQFQSASDCISHAAAVRNRLMNPANAFRPVKPAAVVLTIIRAPAIINYDPPTRAMIAAEPKAHVSDWVDYRVEQVKGVHPKEYVRLRCRQIGVKSSDVRGHTRRRKIVQIRHQLMWELNEFFPEMSLSKIGQVFGGRDHATARHGIMKIREQKGMSVPVQPRMHYRDNDELVAIIKAKYIQGVGPIAIAASHGMSASSIHRLARSMGWKEERMVALWRAA